MDFDYGDLGDYIKNVLGKDYFYDYRCWDYLHDIVYDISRDIDWNGYLKSSRVFGHHDSNSVLKNSSTHNAGNIMIKSGHERNVDSVTKFFSFN